MKKKWIAEGYFNSKFFHKVRKSKFRRDNLLGISLSDVWVDQLDKVKLAVKNHFEERFHESNFRRPTLSDVLFNKLSEKK